jgi:hypothetical protein
MGLRMCALRLGSGHPQAGGVRAKSGAVVVEKDLSDAGGLLEGGEVSGLGKQDRSGATNQGQVGFTLGDARPVVISRRSESRAW